MRGSNSTLIVGEIFVLFLLTACGSSPPTRFYMISADSTSASPSQTSADVSVGVGPIRLPEYLDRPQIVTRGNNARIELAEFDRWAEPLDRSFTAALVDYLSAATGSGQIYGFPWQTRTIIDYRLTAAVNRFDADNGGDAVLIVRWEITDSNDVLVKTTTRSRYTRSAGDGGFPAIVAALNGTISDFGRDVVQALQEIR